MEGEACTRGRDMRHPPAKAAANATWAAQLGQESRQKWPSVGSKVKAHTLMARLGTPLVFCSVVLTLIQNPWQAERVNHVRIEHGQ